MKNATLKLAVLGVFSMASAQSMSAGFVNIPTTGFSGSAYTRCMAQTITIGGNTTTAGNFGSGSTANGNPTPTPTTGANNTCAIVPAPANDISSPETNYAFVTSATRPIVMNNIYTGSSNVTVGNVLEVVWRKPAASAPVTATNMCIIGARVSLTSIAYSTLPDLDGQRFEVNDLARAGLDDLTVDAAYAITNSTASPVYRIGRSIASVQHRALAVAPDYGDEGGALPGTGYLDLPTIGSAYPINGVNRFTGTSANSMPLSNPTSAEQEAPVDSRMVNFTFDANAVDDDGSTNPVSAMTYVKVACDNSANSTTINSAYDPVNNPTGWTRDDVIRLRQTAQELAPFIDVKVKGYVLPGQPAVTPVP